MRNQDQKGNWSYKVLIVDDDKDLREEFRNMVVEHFRSIKVEIAKDGYQAIEMLYFFRPDLIFLDINMPGVDGFEVCRRIKSDGIMNNTKIVIMTGMVHEKLQEKVIEAGAEECVMIPIGFEELFSIIRTYRKQFLLTLPGQLSRIS